MLSRLGVRVKVRVRVLWKDNVPLALQKLLLMGQGTAGEGPE